MTGGVKVIAKAISKAVYVCTSYWLSSLSTPTHLLVVVLFQIRHVLRINGWPRSVEFLFSPLSIGRQEQLRLARLQSWGKRKGGCNMERVLVMLSVACWHIGARLRKALTLWQCIHIEVTSHTSPRHSFYQNELLVVYPAPKHMRKDMLAGTLPITANKPS